MRRIASTVGRMYKAFSETFGLHRSKSRLLAAHVAAARIRRVSATGEQPVGGTRPSATSVRFGSRLHSCLERRGANILRKVAAATGLGVRGDARFALAACGWWRGRAREAKGVLSTRCHIGGSAAATVRHAERLQPVVCDA